MKCPFGVVAAGKDRRICRAKEATCTMAAVDDLAAFIGRPCAEFSCLEGKCNCPVLDHAREVNNAPRILRCYSGSLIPIPKKERRSQCLHAGMNDCITKPVNPNAFNDIIEKGLGRRV